jgi:hypothetical protein
MVAQARMMTHRRDRTLFWGLLASLLLHAVFFMPGVRDVFDVITHANIKAVEEALKRRRRCAARVHAGESAENPVPLAGRSGIEVQEHGVVAGERPGIRATHGADAPHSEGKMPGGGQPGKQGGNDGGGRSETPADAGRAGGTRRRADQVEMDKRDQPAPGAVLRG